MIQIKYYTHNNYLKAWLNNLKSKQFIQNILITIYSNIIQMILIYNYKNYTSLLSNYKNNVKNTLIQI